MNIRGETSASDPIFWLQQLRPRDLGLDQHGLAVIINPVHGKNILGEIDSNSNNLHGLPLSWF